MRTNPPGFSRVSARTRMGGEERDTTPNPAQKPRRGRRVSVPSPSRSLSRCEHARINPHPPSSAIRPRGGAEAARPFAHSRGKRRGAFAQPCGLPTQLALASAARARRRRNASRHVSSSTSARDGHHPPFAASIPRLTILPPRAFPSPPGATRGRGENSPCQSRASDSLLEEVASRLVSRERRDDVGDAPDEPPDSAGPRRPPGSTRGAQEEETDAVARVPGARGRRRRDDDAGGVAAEACVWRRGRV